MRIAWSNLELLEIRRHRVVRVTEGVLRRKSFAEERERETLVLTQNTAIEL